MQPRTLLLLFCVALCIAASACGGDLIAPRAGAIEVRTMTSGPSPDADGYAVSVDGGSALPIAATGSVEVSNLEPGEYSVQLSDVASNCAVMGDNPRSSTVTSGETALVTFAIECAATTGTVEVSTTTVGSTLDPDGYLLRVDGTDAQPIGVQASVQLTDLAPGAHVVELVGLASNCLVQGENPRPVTIAPQATATLAFAIVCLGPARDGILFQSDRSSTFPRYHLYRMRPDGSEVEDLTPTSDGQEGAWSPDGRRIAFTSYRDGNAEIYLMNADGAGVTRLTHDPADDTQPTWSPDGRRIAFVSTRSGGSNVYVMDPDGSDVVSLTGDAGGFEPSWSPDGATIAFSRVVRLCQFDVCLADVFVIPAAGGGATNLTQNAAGEAYEPAWSPDGSKIAYSQDRRIWTIAADGTGKTQLTGGSEVVQDLAPVWSPDGSKLAVRRLLENSEVFVINADGSGATNISNNPANEEATSWR